MIALMNRPIAALWVSLFSISLSVAVYAGNRMRDAEVRAMLAEQRASSLSRRAADAEARAADAEARANAIINQARGEIRHGDTVFLLGNDVICARRAVGT